MTRVLIAVDESEESVRAARRAHELFGPDAQFLAINVSPIMSPWVAPGVGWGGVYAWSPTAYPAVPPVGLPDESGGVANRMREESIHIAEEAAGQAGIPAAEPLTGVGDAPEAIMDAAEAHAVDVIVVGSHDRGWLGRLLAGSTSERVVRRSEVPVLVVK
jgi:nucleotide-binding universal stress UspA family protein